MKKYRFALLLFICIFVTDAYFCLVSFGGISLPALLRMCATAASVSLVFSFMSSKLRPGIGTAICFILLILLGSYAFVELQFKDFLNGYYSFQTVADGGFRVTSFAWYFIKNAKWNYFLTVVPAFIFLYVTLRYRPENEVSPKELIAGILVFLVVFFTLPLGSETYQSAYRNQDNLDIILKEDGITTFFIEDIRAVFTPHSEEELVFENDLTVGEAFIEKLPAAQEEGPQRIFDDSEWLKAMDEEDNETIKTIDQFLMNRDIEQPNEKTGIYEDYNFIYFLVESFDYMGIDEELTPNIYRMYTEGYIFPNHYTPVFSCGTGDSELVSMTSMMPLGSSCTVYTAAHSDLNNSLASLFRNKGYDTFSYHNWDDTFYDRTSLHEAYGMDSYRDIDDLDIQLVPGWQSDNVLMEEALKEFIDSDRFFTFIVTSTMHWPYDEYSYYGDYYLDEINRVHPDYPIEVKRYLSKTMEFDKSLGTLMDALEEKGIADKTVICFWPDHHPFNISVNYIKNYSPVERESQYGIYRTPFILYCKSGENETVDAYCSTFDHVPTIANLFNLNYDPRLYMGSDIFNGNTRVIFNNGNWMNEYGMWSVSYASFFPFEGKELDESEIERNCSEVRNLIKAGRAITVNDYFAFRPFISDPKPLNSEQ
ncbi:MAG: sulfatase-like hydrolase/transferase [Erysipelotrichaceae bacterium]|nr:sulfatase-like hydrolase/transferase [Erysipelotrichaceae bacterium]